MRRCVEDNAVALVQSLLRMNPDLARLLDTIEALCLEHCDEEADPNDRSPDDMTAHVHGLIVQMIRRYREEHP